jgi:MFS family permease
MQMLARVKQFPALLKNDRGFLYFMIARTFAIAGRVAAPFFIVYASTVIHVTGTVIGVLSLVYLGADTLTNLAWGYGADKYGFKSTFVGALAFWIAAAALIMNAHTLGLITVAYFLSGVANAGYQLSAQNMVLEFGHRDDIAMRLALSNTSENTTMAIGPIAVGAIVVGLGYTAVFSLSIVLEATALILMLWLVEEPRKRRAQPSVMSRDSIGESEEDLEAELIEQTSSSREALDPEP